MGSGTIDADIFWASFLNLEFATCIGFGIEVKNIFSCHTLNLMKLGCSWTDFIPRRAFSVNYTYQQEFETSNSFFQS